MKTQEEINAIEVDIDYNDEESIVEGFLKLSAFNRMHEFDFMSAFGFLGQAINMKLFEHAQGISKEDYIIQTHEYGWLDGEDLSGFAVQTNWLYITEDEVKDAIAGLHYDKCRKAFDGLFDELLDIRGEMIGTTNGYDDRQSNVILFDRVIHAQHVTGMIFGGLNIDDVKESLDEEIMELMGIELEVV